MSAIPFFLAEVETQEVLAAWRITDPATLERILIFGAIGVVTTLVLLWAIFLRKKRRRRREHHHGSRHSSGPVETGEAPLDEGVPTLPEKRRHRRRSGRTHRPRNPTLAETGGLPPIRPEDPLEPRP
jgi:hypothetical protein